MARPPISTMRSPALMPASAAGLFGRQAAMIGSPGIQVRPLQADARQAGIQVFALLQAGQNPLDVFHGNGESDSRIVPFHAGHFVGAFGRKGHQHAQHAAADVDQRPAVVVRRDGGVGLDRLAPNAVQR